MSKSRDSKLTGIELEGFQVFDKPTYIPFERLTLVFGPNSAGKSAIDDAMALYDKYFNRRIYKNEADFESDLMRHVRRSSDGQFDFADRMSVSISFTTQLRIDEMSPYSLQYLNQDPLSLQTNNETAQYPQSWFRSEHSFSSKLIFTKKVDDNNKWRRFEVGYELYCDGLLVVCAAENGIKINLAQPCFAVDTQLSFEAEELSKKYPEEIFWNSDCLEIRNGVHGFDFSCEEEQVQKCYSFYPSGKVFNSASSNSNYTQLKEFLNGLGKIVNLVVEVVGNNTPLCHFGVKASRKIPEQKDLIFNYSMTNGYVILDDEKNNQLPFRSRVTEFNYRWLGALIAKDIQRYVDTKNILRAEYADSLAKVNKLLTESLFNETGYKLDFSFKLRLTAEDSQAAFEGRAINNNGTEFGAEVFLRDAHGLRHSFEDVGSGIGYVLPVLIALGDFFIDDRIYIQQPELHLHPALQAAMGDIFIEAANSGTSVVVETHSEHIILRILRRIRERYSNKLITPSLEISPDDVCILYFNPSTDGTTSVKRIRISRNGTFMDRWPRGFFDERYAELFDE